MDVGNQAGAFANLTIKGLSYSDWEDEADQLRQVAIGPAPVRKRHVARAQELLASLQEELDAIDRVSVALTGLDAIRVGCIKDLVVALRAGLVETQRRLQVRGQKRAKRLQTTSS